MHHHAIPWLCALLLLLTGGHASHAQDVSRYKVLSDSAYLSSTVYLAGNKYQKDATVFMDMVAFTHPYFVTPERRAEWFAKKPALVEQCGSVESDEAFVDLLEETLGPLRDGHTSLTTLQRIQESRRAARPASQTQDVPGSVDMDPIMRRHASNYDYRLFPDQSICYLQFNQCMDVPDAPFETFLDDMFARMEENRIKTLVVDAQYNSGGSSRLCGQLLLHLRPWDKMQDFTTYIRFSDLMAAYDPRIAKAKVEWQSHGHQDELYRVPAQKRPKGFRQPKLFKGRVVFVMGKRTYSSAGILLTLARDNHIGTIIGTTSTFSPSHFGEILPYRLPNTGVLGSIPCKYFVRPDAATADAPCLEPDIAIDLDDKDASWRFICESFGSQL